MTKPADKPQWVRIVEQFKHSGLTQKQFAQQQGLPLSTVQSWIYRRRHQVAAPPAASRLVPSWSSPFRTFLRHTCNMTEDPTV